MGGRDKFCVCLRKGLTMRQFVISDIHGCLLTFRALLEEISFSERNDELFLLGDFTDRGPDSKGVLDYVLNMKENGAQVHALRGNHDQMLLDAHKDDEACHKWLGSGGKETLKSFGVNHVHDIPDEYIEFFMGLPCFLEVGQYILVHAGLDFQGKDPLGNESAMMWIRNWYDSIDYGWLGDRIILHGHTPLFRDEINQQHGHLARQQYLGLDNGCVYTEKFYRDLGLGSLCAFELGSQTLTFVKNRELGLSGSVPGPKSRMSKIFSLFSL